MEGNISIEDEISMEENLSADDILSDDTEKSGTEPWRSGVLQKIGKRVSLLTVRQRMIMAVVLVLLLSAVLGLDVYKRQLPGYGGGVSGSSLKNGVFLTVPGGRNPANAAKTPHAAACSRLRSSDRPLRAA